MSKRLAFLEKLVNEGKPDAFARYCLALEYRNAERLEDARTAFQTLRNLHPDYVPMYLMGGGLLEKLGQKDEAREWYQTGIAVAAQKGDAHARSELEGALGALGQSAPPS